MNFRYSINENLPELTEDEFFGHLDALSNPQTNQALIPQIYLDLISRKNFGFIFLNYMANKLSRQPNPAHVTNLQKVLFSTPTSIYILNYDYFDVAVECFENAKNSQQSFTQILSQHSNYPTYLQYLEELFSSENKNPHIVSLLIFAMNVLFPESEAEADHFLTMYFECVNYFISNNLLHRPDNEFEVARSIENLFQHIGFIIKHIPARTIEYYEFILKFLETITQITSMNAILADMYNAALNNICTCPDLSEIYPTLIELGTFMAEHFLNFSDTFNRRILSSLNLNFNKLAFEDEEQLVSLIHFLILATKVEVDQNMKANPEQFYTTLFELDFTEFIPLVQNCREFSPIIFSKLADKQEIGMGALLEAIFTERENESDDDKVYILCSLAQIRFNYLYVKAFKTIPGKILEDLNLIGQYIIECIGVQGLEDYSYLLMYSVICTVNDEDAYSQFPVDVTSQEDTLEIRTALSLYFRMLSNSIIYGHDTFKTDESVAFVLENKHLALGNDADRAYGVLTKYLPDNSGPFILDYLSGQMEKLQAVLQDYTDESENILVDIIRSINDVIKHMFKFLNFSQFMETYLQFLPMIQDKTSETAEYLSVFPSFLDVPANFPQYMELIFYLFDDSRMYCYINDVCRDFAVSIDENNQFLSTLKEEGKTYAMVFLEKSIQLLSQTFSLEVIPGTQIQVSSQYFSQIESLDYESVILVAIKIVQTQELPNDLIQAFCEAVLEKMGRNHDDLMEQFIGCEFFAGLLPKHPEFIPPEINELMIYLMQQGTIRRSYHRALFGIAMTFISRLATDEEAKQMFGSLATSLLTGQQQFDECEIDLENFSNEIFTSGYPNYQFLNGFEQVQFQPNEHLFPESEPSSDAEELEVPETA